MTRIRKDPAQRRQELIQISMKLFTEKGYNSTMVQDICSAAGIAKGTFFYYFPAKEDVLKEIFLTWGENFKARCLAVGAGKDGAARLRLFLHLFGQESPMDDLIDRLEEDHQGDLLSLYWSQCASRVLNPLLLDMIDQGRKEGTMSTEHPALCLDFFWAILDAWWKSPSREEEETLDERTAIAQRQLEVLFGMKRHGLEMA